MGELEYTLKWFKKDKSPGPDGWFVEFYTAFFEILGEDLLKVIEECRILGRMYEAFNSTFIALIPKSNNPNSFNDFRPISLGNGIYKIITKSLRIASAPFYPPTSPLNNLLSFRIVRYMKL